MTVHSSQLTVALLLLFSTGLAQAAPVGSPASLLKKGQWDFALEGSYVSERPMEYSGSSDYEVSLTSGFHSRSYGLTDRLMITGRVGGSYGYLYNENVSGSARETTLGGGLGLGLQLKGIIWEDKLSGLEWDASAQFLYLRSHHKRSGKANADWYEWQADTALAKAIGKFKPYAGVKFSVATLDYDDGKGSTTSYDQDGSVGPFAGADIYLGEDGDIVINLEGGFLLGAEFSGAVKYRF